LILKNTNSNDPELISNAYFVIAAKSNNQPPATVLNLFTAAFKNAETLNIRYKLITKLGNHDLLLNESVLNCLLLSNAAKDWEVYLGLIISNNLQKDFQELWQQSNSNSKLDTIIRKAIAENWQQVKKLLNIIMNSLSFILGDVEN
jgi:hypothetical protein